MTRTRTRPRAINTDDNKVATTEMKAKAREFFVANAQKNAANRKAEAARKKLLTLMTDAEIKEFSFTTKHEDKTVTLDVGVATSETMVVDVEKLRSLVSEKQFMEIVSATHKSVTDHVGAVIATRCSTTKKGNTNVSVKAAK